MAEDPGLGMRLGTPERADDEIARWMDAHGGAVLRFAYARLRDRQEAEDAFQEVFLRAYRARRSLREPEQARAWLLRIAQNVCASRTRHHSHRSEEPDSALEFVESGPGPEADALRHSEEAELLRHVLRLPVAMRDAIVLFYFEELTVREAATVLGCSEHAAKTRLHRARRHLREVLEFGGASDGR